jgi:hypothetical protein
MQDGSREKTDLQLPRFILTVMLGKTEAQAISGSGDIFSAMDQYGSLEFPNLRIDLETGWSSHQQGKSQRRRDGTTEEHLISRLGMHPPSLVISLRFTWRPHTQRSRACPVYYAHADVACERNDMHGGRVIARSVCR